MTLSRKFGLRVSATERKMIAALADHLQRTQSDAVRLLIREAARELGVERIRDDNSGDRQKRVEELVQ